MNNTIDFGAKDREIRRLLDAKLAPVLLAEQIRSLYACIDALERRVRELENR